MMFWLRAVALSALVALSHSAPLSRVDAESAKARLKKLKTFTDDFHTVLAGKTITDCKARSTIFANQCANKASITCRDTSTSANKPNSVCCKDGEKKCENDANGKEYSGMVKCCDHCNNQTLLDMKPEYAAWCSAAGQKTKGATVCGTTAGTCGKCMAGNSVISDKDSKNSCESQGMCTVGGLTSSKWGASMCKGRCSTDPASGPSSTTKPMCVAKVNFCSDMTKTTKSACVSPASWMTPTWNDATYQAGTWTMLPSQNTEAKCAKDDKCMRCKSCGTGCPGEKTSCISGSGECSKTAGCPGGKCAMSSQCTQAGGVWTPPQWTEVVGKTKDSCSATLQEAGHGPATWERTSSWAKGNTLPAQGATDCTTGPTHEEPSHMLPTGTGSCLSQGRFLADALAGKTVADAMAGNTSYYKSASRMILAGASVVNHVNATSRAEMKLTSKTCFVIVPLALNHGKFTLSGSSKTYALITEPTNFADADDLKVTGGSASVLGGFNAGNLVSTTTGSFEVYSLTNRGNVTISGASNVIIADVQNKGGKILVTNMPSVTLINVQSYGSITANGAEGNYKGYDIVNTGMVTINAGTINLHFKCNTGGTVTVGNSVTGSISYESGCKGTITAPSAVTLTELGASATPAKKVSGTIKFKVPTANAAAFKTEPKVKKALQSAIASMIDGVDSYMVEIKSVTRRLDENNGRRLADASVTVNYVITLPASSSVTTAKVSTAMTGTAAKSALKTGVNKELVDEGITAYAVTAVEELSAAEAATGAGTSGTSGTTALAPSSVSASAVAFMCMMAVQLKL